MAILYGDEKHTLEDAGFDSLLRKKDVVREEERQFNQQVKDRRDQEERRERVRIERLKLTNGNVLLYAIQEIIKLAEIHRNKPDPIQTSAYELGFEESVPGTIAATKFLKGLEMQGCIKDSERLTNEYVSFKQPDIAKLREYAAELVSSPKTAKGNDLNIEKPKKQSREEIFQCGLLHVDFSTGSMRYRTNAPIEISPSTREIKLLKLLMSTGAVVKYWEAAKALDLPTYREAENDNRKYARDIQFVRRNLVDILEKAGMTKAKINLMIIAKKNIGYVLRHQYESQTNHTKVT